MIILQYFISFLDISLDSMLVTKTEVPFYFLWKCVMVLLRKLKLLSSIVTFSILGFLLCFSRAVKSRFLCFFLVEKKIHKEF